MEVSPLVINFGTIEVPNIVLSMTILNSGGSKLIGNITSEDWLEISSTKFEIQPSSTAEFQITLKKNRLPEPQSKYEFRSASAIIIESNSGVEVIGAMYKFPKRGLFG